MYRSPKVWLAVGDRVVAVDEDGVQVLGEHPEIGPVQKMVASTKRKLLAEFSHNGRPHGFQEHFFSTGVM
jgi:hypothetical protein